MIIIIIKIILNYFYHKKYVNNYKASKRKKTDYPISWPLHDNENKIWDSCWWFLKSGYNCTFCEIRMIVSIHSKGGGCFSLGSQSTVFFCLSILFFPLRISFSSVRQWLLVGFFLLFLILPVRTRFFLSSYPPSATSWRRYVGCATSLPGNRYLAGFTLNGARHTVVPHTRISFSFVTSYARRLFSLLTSLESFFFFLPVFLFLLFEFFNCHLNLFIFTFLSFFIFFFSSSRKIYYFCIFFVI